MWMMEKTKTKLSPQKSSPITKNVKVSIETLTLKPVMPVVMPHPQTARRGFCPVGGGTK